MNTYSTSILQHAACPILKVDYGSVLARTKLPQTLKDKADTQVSRDGFIAIWLAMIAEAGPKFDPIFLGRMMANGPIIPLFLAFSCAPNLSIGVQRFASFKSLFGPIALNVQSNRTGLSIEIRPEGGGPALPPSLSVPFAVFLTEKARSHAAHTIVPLRLGLPSGVLDDDTATAYFGRAPNPSSTVRLDFTRQDMHRPFVSENTAIWREVEQELQQKRSEQRQDLSFHAEVEQAIRTAMYGGHTQAEAISHQLGMSRSTLQRRLANEGVTYQSIIDRVRAELATRYLIKTTFRSAEIANLIGFRDPKSFYRAFRKWYGMTPESYRTRFRT